MQHWLYGEELILEWTTKALESCYVLLLCPSCPKSSLYNLCSHRNIMCTGICLASDSNTKSEFKRISIFAWPPSSGQTYWGRPGSTQLYCWCSLICTCVQMQWWTGGDPKRATLLLLLIQLLATSAIVKAPLCSCPIRHRVLCCVIEIHRFYLLVINCKAEFLWGRNTVFPV